MAVRPRSAWEAISQPVSTIGVQDIVASKYLWMAIAVIIHLFDTVLMFNRRELVGVFFIAYFFFGMVSWLLTYGGISTYDGVHRGTLHFERLFLLWAAGLVSWGLPWIRAIFFRFLPTGATLYVDSIIVFFPVMVLFLMLWPGFGTTASSKASTFYIIFWLILFSINFFANVDTINIGELNVAALEVYAPQLISVTQPVMMMLGSIRNAAVRSFDYVMDVPEKVRLAIQQQVQYAIDPAASAVQESNAKRIGVFLSGLKKTGVKLYAGDEIALFSDIESRLLEEDDEITVDLDCVATLTSSPVKEWSELLQREKEQTFIGKVVPSRQLQLYSLDKQSVDCRWPTQLSIPGNYKIELFAAFNFNTLGYVPIFYTSRDQLRQYVRDDAKGKPVPVDLSTQPTLYTSGPVEVGLSMGQGTIGIEEAPRVYTLDMWVKNAWQGKVLKVNNLYLMVPKPFEIASIVGLGFGVENDSESLKTKKNSGCAALKELFDQDYCDDENTNVYKIYVEDKELKTRRNIRVDLDLPDPYALIGQEPYVKKFVKVVADYRYEFNPKTSITVHEPPEEAGDSPVLDIFGAGGAGAR